MSIRTSRGAVLLLCGALALVGFVCCADEVDRPGQAPSELVGAYDIEFEPRLAKGPVEDRFLATRLDVRADKSFVWTAWNARLKRDILIQGCWSEVGDELRLEVFSYEPADGSDLPRITLEPEKRVVKVGVVHRASGHLNFWGVGSPFRFKRRTP